MSSPLSSAPAEAQSASVSEQNDQLAALKASVHKLAGVVARQKAVIQRMAEQMQNHKKITEGSRNRADGNE